MPVPVVSVIVRAVPAVAVPPTPRLSGLRPEQSGEHDDSKRHDDLLHGIAILKGYDPRIGIAGPLSAFPILALLRIRSPEHGNLRSLAVSFLRQELTVAFDEIRSRLVLRITAEGGNDEAWPFRRRYGRKPKPLP